MSIHLDYKTNSLVVEISEIELQQMIQQLCVEHEQKELIKNKIDNVIYLIPMENKKTKKSIFQWGILLSLTMLISWGIFALGLWKLLELIIKITF